MFNQLSCVFTIDIQLLHQTDLGIVDPAVGPGMRHIVGLAAE